MLLQYMCYVFQGEPLVYHYLSNTCVPQKYVNNAAHSVCRTRQVTPQKTNEAVLLY